MELLKKRRSLKQGFAVNQIDLHGNIINTFNSLNEAVGKGFNESHISKCCRGMKNHRSHKGFIWKFAENEYLTKEEEEKEVCHVCGKTDVELVECECCHELCCDDCSSTYTQFTQIDYNCCKPCSKRKRE